MGEQFIRQAAELYGLNVHDIVAIEKGYRNQTHAFKVASGEQYNLILYKSEPGDLERITRANVVSNFLAEHGFPSRQLADRQIVQVKTPKALRYAALYNYLPGQTIPWESYTMEHLKLLGQTMSDMHTILHKFPASTIPSVIDEYQAVLDHMSTYFSRPTVINAITQKLGVAISHQTIHRLKAILEACATVRPGQVLHMDFVRGNILFGHKNDGRYLQITGILDFEKIAVGIPLFDVARTLAFLIVDCKYKTETQVRKYFLHSGYNKRGKIKLKDYRLRIKASTTSLLEALIDLFLFYDFYKFLRHNPYESLELNEHFTRTKQQLFERSILLPLAQDKPKMLE